MADTEPITTEFIADTSGLVTGLNEGKTALRQYGDETERTENKFRLFNSRGLNLLSTLLAVRGAIAISSDVMKSFGLQTEHVERVTQGLTLALNIGIAILAVYRTALLLKAAAEFIAAKASLLHAIGIGGLVIPIAGLAIAAAIAAGAWFSIHGLPELAQGGIVSRPTIAMIGEQGPEAVVPLSKSAGGFGATGAIGGITVQGPLIGSIATNDPDYILRVLGRRIEQLKAAGA